VKKSKVVLLCIVMVAVFTVFGVLAGFTLYSFFNPVSYYNTFGKYDTEWMVGKTVDEVVERYGLMDYGYEWGGNAYKIRDTVYVLIQTKDSVVVSAEYVSVLEREMDYDGAAFFLSWAQGKSFGTILETVGEPQYFLDDSTVIYEIRIWYVSVLLDGSYETENSSVVSTEPLGWFSSSEIPEEWNIWDNSTKAPGERTDSWIPMGILGGVLILLVAGTATVLLPLGKKERC